ncbi:hypothetical protein FCV25MIE_12943, partial [Fagus crenata]
MSLPLPLVPPPTQHYPPSQWIQPPPPPSPNTLPPPSFYFNPSSAALVGPPSIQPVLHTTPLPWYFPTPQPQTTTPTLATNNTANQNTILNTKPQIPRDTNPPPPQTKHLPIKPSNKTRHHEGVSVNFGKKRDLGKKFDNGKLVMEIHRPKSQAHKAEANALAHKPRVKEVDQEPRGKEEAHDPRVDEEAHEPRVNETAPKPDKGIWVPKQTQPVLGLVDQLELISQPRPAMVDHNGEASSSQMVGVSSSHRVLHDEDSETVDSVSEEDEITAEEVEEEESTAEEVIRDLVLHLSISAEPGIECVTLDDVMEFEVVGLEKSTPLLLDEVSGHSSPTLPLAWSSRPDLDRSPIVCEPLAKIDPLSFSEFTEQYSGNVLALEEAMSLWVEQKYKEFGELVGMPIEGFEAECITLLRRIDAERKRGRYQPSSRKPTRLTKK